MVQSIYNFDSDELIEHKDILSISDISEITINGLDTIVNVDRSLLYLGGGKFLSYYFYNDFNYPQEAVDMGSSGTIIVELTISKKGKLIKVEVVSNDTGYKPFDEESIKAAESIPDNWLPIIYKGQPVASKLFFPIRLRIR